MERIQVIDKIKEIYLSNPNIFDISRYNKTEENYINGELKKNIKQYVRLGVTYIHEKEFYKFIGNINMYSYRIIDLNKFTKEDYKTLIMFKRFAQYMNSIENKY